MNNIDTQSNGTEAKEPYMYLIPGKMINMTSNLASVQQTVLSGIMILMLHIASLDWMNSSILKGTLQLIKALASMIICKSHIVDILTIKSPWILYSDLKQVLRTNL